VALVSAAVIDRWADGIIPAPTAQASPPETSHDFSAFVGYGARMRKRWIVAGIVFLALAGGYTGYWFWLADTFQRNLALWIEQQRAMGYRLSYSAGEPDGFPLAAKIQLSDVTVEPAPSMAPWRLGVPSMQLSIAPWQPLALRIGDNGATTDYRLQWSANGRDFELSGAGIRTTIGLSSQAKPPTIRFAAERLEWRLDNQSLANTHRLEGEIVMRSAPASTDPSIEFSIDASQLDLLVGTPSQQRTKEIYGPGLKGRFIGAIPAGPLVPALAAWSQQGGYLDLINISARPADGFPPRFEGSASVALDPQLQPIVAGTVTVHDYGPAIDRAVADGHMTPSQGTATRLWLSARAEKDNGGLKVTLPVTIQDGFVSVGPIKLAQVPRIAWD
jgi:Uncharacterized protein conserved in bacteria (DUF2125)